MSCFLSNVVAGSESLSVVCLFIRLEQISSGQIVDQQRPPTRRHTKIRKRGNTMPPKSGRLVDTRTKQNVPSPIEEGGKRK
ncbi:hypothetical protein VTJ04DRAFT_1124 [Mycothermus thermophilus]|uniref:uncharacterized protein n=1 Tax=Humicola insolens TaxID=85995 RepID=UPI0037420A84